MRQALAGNGWLARRKLRRAIAGGFGLAIAAAPGAGVAVSDVPDVSPASMAAVEAQVRQSWQGDAYPVMVTVNALGGNGFAVAMDFVSPTAGGGLTVVVTPAGTSTLRTGNPSWGTTAIPEAFRALSDLLAAAGQPAGTTVTHAELYWRQDQLVWSVTLDNGSFATLPANPQ
jgi:hypothetical protein